METAIRKKLALRIRHLRRKKGWTQEKLSEMAEVDYKHIQLLESKTPPYPRLDTIEKLAKAFGISISSFLKL